MADTRLSLKKLSHRNWEELREEWLSYVPAIDFELRYPEPTLWQLADFPNFFGSLVDGNVLEHVEGVRESIFREMLILTRKFNHAHSMVNMAAAEGRATWASINAYETCFYGAKAFCYLLGFANLGRDSSYYLDAFFEVKLKRRKGLVEQRFDMKIHRLPERFTHAMLWGLTERLIETTAFENELAQLRLGLRKIDWKDFSKFRNYLMYDGAYWTKLDSYEECDLINAVSDIGIYRAATGAGVPSSLPFAEEYFSVLHLLRSALSLMLGDIARNAPLIQAEVDAIHAPS